VIDREAVVSAFTRLEGPCYVGPGTQLKAALVHAGTTLGPECRVGGEVESSIVQGYSNKAHEGFLGHSYLGEWVNLGAGTQTSDLRNDYGKVAVTVSGQRVETGLLKVGSFIGDHTKTSIDTLFNTGSVCGPFGMLVTSGGLLPRCLPAFCLVSQGRVRERTDLRAMFATAETMMARRGLAWSQEHTDFYLDLYERSSSERARAARSSLVRPVPCATSASRCPRTLSRASSSARPRVSSLSLAASFASRSTRACSSERISSIFWRASPSAPA